MSETKKTPYHEEAPQLDFENFAKVVDSRRAVRGFDIDVKVPDDVVNRCLDLALLAPNSSNAQMWRFHWIKGPELREKMVKACMSQPAARTAPTIIVATAWTKAFSVNSKRIAADLKKAGVGKGAIFYYEKLVPAMYRPGPFNLFAPLKWLTIFIAGFKRPVPRGPYTAADVKLAAHKSVALACENLMLAFRAAGYDTCPMEGFDEKMIRRELQLSSDESVVMVISAGKRRPGGIYGARARFDRSESIKERF